jgi:hypothetical protein
MPFPLPFQIFCWSEGYLWYHSLPGGIPVAATSLFYRPLATFPFRGSVSIFYRYEGFGFAAGCIARFCVVPDLSKGKSPEKGEPSRVTNLLDVLVIKILERAQGGHGRGWRGPQIDENHRKDRRILVGSTREGSG